MKQYIELFELLLWTSADTSEAGGAAGLASHVCTLRQLSIKWWQQQLGEGISKDVVGSKGRVPTMPPGSHAVTHPCRWAGGQVMCLPFTRP